MNRETWLNNLARKMAPRFESLGFPLPSFRVAIGFTSHGKRGSRIAECWSPLASADNVSEIFIRPDHNDSHEVAASLAHELAHAAVGLKEGHRGNFKRVCLGLGLQGPMKSTTAGPEFVALVKPLIEELGPIPHAPLRINTPKLPPVDGSTDGEGGEAESSAPPKQTTRLLKCVCTECGYTVRVTAKWLDIGAPHCPQHGAMNLDDGGQE